MKKNVLKESIITAFIFDFAIFCLIFVSKSLKEEILLVNSCNSIFGKVCTQRLVDSSTKGISSSYQADPCWEKQSM